VIKYLYEFHSQQNPGECIWYNETTFFDAAATFAAYTIFQRVILEWSIGSVRCRWF